MWRVCSQLYVHICVCAYFKTYIKNVNKWLTLARKIWGLLWRETCFQLYTLLHYLKFVTMCTCCFFKWKNTFFWTSYYLELRSIYVLCQELEFGRWKFISSLSLILIMLLTFHQSDSGFEGGWFGSGRAKENIELGIAS